MPKADLSYRREMQRGTEWITATGLGVVLVLLLAACTESPPPSSRSSAENTLPTSPPLSTSALVREAKDLYRGYLAASSHVAQDGGKRPERLIPFLTNAEYQVEQSSAQSLSNHNYHTTGNLKSRGFTLQSVNTASRQLNAYVCLDSKNLRLLDSKDSDVQQEGAEPEGTLLVSFAEEAGRLKIRKSEAWSGQSVC